MPTPLVLPWFITQNIYNESIKMRNKNKPFKNNEHLFYLFSIFYYKSRQRAKWAATQVAIMLADHKQIDKRTTMKNQNRNAALGRPAIKLGRGGGGELHLVFEVGVEEDKPP